MLSLFMAIANGVSWKEVLAPLRSRSDVAIASREVPKVPHTHTLKFEVGAAGTLG